MTAKKNPKSGEEFTELSVRLADSTFQLCNETYAATQSLPSAKALRYLIQRAEEHIADYHELLSEYTGGRLAAIKEAGIDVPRLIEFTTTLKHLSAKS